MHRVPKLYIEIPKYDFSGNDSDLFLGRNEAKNRLVRRIRPKSNYKPSMEYRGCYLVSGYRGMGKTKLVDKAIEEVNKKNKILPVHISLSQSGLDEYQVLRQVFTEFNNHIIGKEGLKRRRTLHISKTIISLISFVCGFYYFYDKIVNSIDSGTDLSSGTGFFFLFVALVSSLFIQSILFGGLNLLFRDFLKFESKRRSISRRLFSKMEEGTTSTKLMEGFGAGSSLINTAIEKFSNSDGSYRLNYEIISAKELEIEVQTLLNYYQEIKNAKPVLFIVDELDKLEPEFLEGDGDFFSLGKSRRMTRKESLVRILAALKSFIHTSEAKFIFIGGAELYDASLADIADRESFYSSIFHEVIYIDSFFKDFEEKKVGLTQMVELYVSKLLFGKELPSDHHYGLNYFHSKIVGLDNKTRDFLLYSIYNFTVYLTYRSNGSPKKLKELIEYHISYCGLQDHHTEDLIIERSQNQLFSKMSTKLNKNSIFDSRSFIQLSFGNQHKIGLLSKIFKPYFITNERFLKSTNDRTLYLTAFLMDHILKFHKSAFSWKEIELVPDIIMGNQGPNLRDTISNIIDYLSLRHIRTTSNAMFTYKFRSRTAMELKFISKISDESSAAYNFTYDESQHLKSFFKRKLKQKIETYSTNAFQNNDTNVIHSIVYLNSTIGDIHYYDEEYEPAIRYYLDSIQRIRDLMIMDDRSISRHQKMIFTRNRLILSLCLEKSMKYDSAYSTVRSIMLDLKTIDFRASQKIVINNDYQRNIEEDKIDNKIWESPYKRMQLYLRPFLALLTLIEKDRSDGITVSNLKRNIKDYADFLEVEELFPSSDFRNLGYREFTNNYKKEGKEAMADHKRIQTLLSDYYQNVGSILFFKNRIYKSLHEEYTKWIWEDQLNVSNLGKSFETININLYKLIGEGENRIKQSEKIEARTYSSLKAIKEHLNILDKSSFHPSYTSFSYYVIALGHIMTPYVENILAINDNRNSSPKEFRHFDLLNKLSVKEDYLHILNSGQQYNLAVISSKIGDSILGSTADLEGFIGQFKTFEDLMDSSKLNDICNSQIPFDSLFSINTIIFFYTRSYRLFDQSGHYYDALFQLKKILYLLRSHKIDFNKNRKIGYSNLASIIIKEATQYTREKGLCIKSKKETLYKEVFNLPQNLSPLSTSYLLESSDTLEIRILAASIDFRLDSSLISDLDKTIPNIRSIYIRIQTLRYIFDYKVGLITHSQSEQDNVLSVFTLLQNSIKTYGFTYIMSYTYYASLCDKMSSFITKYKPTLKTQMNANDLRLEALEYYKKALRLHSEGKEYKTFVQNMYVLDDDFNDSLVHFSAALERSLMNTGFINSRINVLNMKDS